MAGSLVNARLVNAKVFHPAGSRSSSEHLGSSSSEFREPAGLRFLPLNAPPLRSVKRHNIKGNSSNSSIRSLAADGNGNGSSNSSADSRMVPIEEALKGRSATFLTKRPSNGAARRSTNGATTIDRTPTNGTSTNGSTDTEMARRTTLSAGRTVTRRGENGAVARQGLVPNGDGAKRVLLQAPGNGNGNGGGLYDGQARRVLPSDEGFSWARDDYSVTKRNIDVWSFVLSLRSRVWLVDTKWTYVTGFTEAKQKARQRSLAVWVREKILQLGPTFIKLGQLSSTRSDLFPAEIVEELAKLQDQVPAFSADKAMAFIENELGAPVDALFADFEQQPIAAASLGQVHRAILPNGERVVVKVQRPGLKRLFDIDLNNLKVVAQYFQSSESLGGPTRDWLGIYEECATILYQEIDYLNEGRNADRFRRDFRKQKWVKVPQVFWDYASQKVLTLEYAPGIKINDIAVLEAGGFDKAKLASLAIEAYLIQILRTGFFHADPHPGNLAVDADGSLIYYDFGMMGEIKSFTRERLLEMFYAVYEKDAQKIIQALIALGALLPTGDMGSVRRSVQYFLDNLMDQKPDQAATFSAIGEDLFAIAVDQPFRFPATFTFVLRAFSTLEGIGNTLDPDFSFAKIAAPYAQELLDTRNGQRNGSQYFVQELQRQAADARDATVAMPLRVQRVDKILRQLEAGDLKLRVRSLEAERAARRQSVMQMATMNTIFSVGLANIGVTLSTAQGVTAVSNSSFVGAGVFFLLLANNIRRIRNLDKFEKML